MHIRVGTAFLSVLEAQAIDRARACLVHDPAEHRAIRGVVTRRASPNAMKNVDGELFGGFRVSRVSHDKSKDGAMSPLVESMKREWVPRSNGSDERHPVLLRHRI